MSNVKNWFKFFRREVWPRRQSVFFHRNFVSAVLISVLVTTVAAWLPLDAPFRPLTFSELCTATLAFSGLSFGGAVTALVLALGLPESRLLDTMVVNASDGSTANKVTANGVVSKDGPRISSSNLNGKPSIYADLVFVFQLTAVAQLMLAIASIATMSLVGGSRLSPTPSSFGPSLGLMVMTAFAWYSIAQLLSSLKAIGDLARQRDTFVRIEVLQRGA